MCRCQAMAPMVVGHRSGTGDLDQLCRGPAPHTTYEVACGSTRVVRRHSSFEDLRILLEMRGVKGLPLVPAKGSVVLRRLLPKRRAALVQALNAFLAAVVAADPLLTTVELRIFLGLPLRGKTSDGPKHVFAFLSGILESETENDFHESEMENEDIEKS